MRLHISGNSGRGLRPAKRPRSRCNTGEVPKHHSPHRLGQWIPAIALALLAAACSSHPGLMESRAAEFAFQRSAVQGTEFMHAVYLHRPPDPRARLHVYLEGDGIPWEDRRRVAPDPTPRHSLVLELMRLDPAPSLMLGRPCYHGHAGDPGCSPLLWTHQRYAPRVVDSMAAALERLLEDLPGTELVLIGHSGGGALAMLLAERLPQTAGVITIGANLDVEAWTRLHGYSPLDGSLNPAARPPLHGSIAQLHLAGGRDRRVPPGIIQPASDRQPDARFRVFEDYDHRCCWARHWPALLEQLDD